MPLLWIRQEWDEKLSVGSDNSAKRKFQIVTDELEYPQPQAVSDLWAYLVAEGLDTYGNLPVSGIEADRLNASKCFMAFVSYGPRSLPQDGVFDFTVESRPETRKQMNYRAVAAQYSAPGYNVGTTNGFVGVTDEGTAEGIDVSYTISRYNAQVYWDTTRFVGSQPSSNYQSLQAYVDLLKSLVNKVNSEFFQFFAVGALEKFQPGECRLLSTKRSFQGSTLIRFDLELEATARYVDPMLTVMNGGTPVYVSGFDRVEFPQQKSVDPATKTLSPIARRGIVAQLHDRADLNLLLVPTP